MQIRVCCPSEAHYQWREGYAAQVRHIISAERVCCTSEAHYKCRKGMLHK